MIRCVQAQDATDLAVDLPRESGMTPTEISRGERLMLGLICVPAILMGLLFLIG